MKTGQIPPKQIVASPQGKEKVHPDPTDRKAAAPKDVYPGKPVNEPSERITLDRTVINNPEAVKKMIGENIQWRDMKFYQRNEGGDVYIDIVDRSTGNVVRTIPDTKFRDVVESFKQTSGLKIDISG